MGVKLNFEEDYSFRLFKRAHSKSIKKFIQYMIKLPFANPYKLYWNDYNYLAFTFSAKGEMVFKDTSDGEMLIPVLTLDSLDMITAIEAAIHENNQQRERLEYKLEVIDNVMVGSYLRFPYERIFTPHYKLIQKTKLPPEEFFNGGNFDVQKTLPETKKSWDLFNAKIEEAFRNILGD